MALSQTTLTAPVVAGDTTLTVASTTGMTPGNPIRLDSEVAYIVALSPVASTTSVVVRMRGSEGTAAVPHQTGTMVITGSGQDFPAWPTGLIGQLPPSADDVLTIGVNTAVIACPTKPTIYMITKATALSGTTLAAPPIGSNGIQIRFISQTSAAHVITTAALYDNGLTGSPFSTATFGAFPGAGFSAVSNNGFWNIVALPIAASTAFS